MRSTSSAHRRLALFLSIVLAMEGPVAAIAATEALADPCLLLKIFAPPVSEATARSLLAPMPQLLSRDLAVRWVPLPAPAQVPADLKELFPDPDDASLERISGKMAEALRRMDRMETSAAAVLLSEAEREGRKFRLGDATRPFFAEIFLRRGLLYLWEGNRASAEEMFARSGVLQPGFSPDPGLFSPSFREAWARAGERPPPEADLLVQSIPPGASVYLDGKRAGTTPGRVKVPTSGPVRLRLSLAGYQEFERAGQWLPGDSEVIESVLVRDRLATLGDSLAASPDGKGSGPLLAELTAGAGASRTALLVLAEENGKPVLRVFSSGRGSSDPAFLGRIEWLGGNEGAAEAAATTAVWLRNAGWPGVESRRDEGASWYRKWWVWLLIGAAAIGAAAAAGGGGGSGGGSSTGSVGVTF